MPTASRSPFKTAAGLNALGAPGGALGYAGIGSSVAIKFDLYNNAGEGGDSTGFYTDGAIPTIPALSMAASGVNLHSTHMMHAHITYDGTTLTLVLTDTVTGGELYRLAGHQYSRHGGGQIAPMWASPPAPEASSQSSRS